MKRVIRLFALVAGLGFVGLTGANAAGVKPLPIEQFCMCGCADGTVVCVSSINGDCGPACAQACSGVGM